MKSSLRLFRMPATIWNAWQQHGNSSTLCVTYSTNECYLREREKNNIERTNGILFSLCLRKSNCFSLCARVFMLYVWCLFLGWLVGCFSIDSLSLTLTLSADTGFFVDIVWKNIFVSFVSFICSVDRLAAHTQQHMNAFGFGFQKSKEVHCFCLLQFFRHIFEKTNDTELNY